MTQNEFETRVRMEVSSKEFESINEVYMNSDLDKDEFCKAWVKMNKSRVAKAIAEAKAEEEAQELKWKAVDLYYSLEKYGWMNLAISALPEKAIKFIESLGIEMEVKNWGYYFRTIGDIHYELGKYAGILA